MIAPQRVTDILITLVSTESVNPDLVSGGSGERQIASYVAAFLKDAGLHSELVEIAPGRFNVIGRLRGKETGKALLLNGHLDTVGVTGMDDPFSARVENGRLFGRGAQDMKSGLAAILTAAEALARDGLPGGELIVAAVADEEYRSIGTSDVIARGIRADAAVVTEPTGLEIAAAHKGFAWAAVETYGRAAHGSRPADGVDAIAHMGRVLRDIENLQQRLAASPGHPLLGPGSVHASIISGGQELSSYPARCRLDLERRLIPGEGGPTLEAEIGDILARLSAADPRFKATYSPGYWASSLETPSETPIVGVLARVAREVLGREPEIGAVSFWTDAALLSAAGIPAVLLGPTGAGLHSDMEYVELDSVFACAEILYHCTRQFCQKSR
jgi:acetylornithine deacetylase